MQRFKAWRITVAIHVISLATRSRELLSSWGLRELPDIGKFNAAPKDEVDSAIRNLEMAGTYRYSPKN